MMQDAQDIRWLVNLGKSAARRWKIAAVTFAAVALVGIPAAVITRPAPMYVSKMVLPLSPYLRGIALSHEPTISMKHLGEGSEIFEVSLAGPDQPQARLQALLTRLVAASHRNPINRSVSEAIAVLEVQLAELQLPISGGREAKGLGELINSARSENLRAEITRMRARMDDLRLEDVVISPTAPLAAPGPRIARAFGGVVVAAFLIAAMAAIVADKLKA
ncbi:hypothetical protein [Bradyrhizobium guangdongense]